MTPEQGPPCIVCHPAAATPDGPDHLCTDHHPGGDDVVTFMFGRSLLVIADRADLEALLNCRAVPTSRLHWYRDGVRIIEGTDEP